MTAVRIGAAVACCGVLAGGIAACTGQSSADALWGRPAESAARDAHATVVASGTRVAFRGDGTVVFKPNVQMSLRLQERTGSLHGELDVVMAGGATYTRSPSEPWWTRSAAPAPLPTGEGATQPRLLGQERIGGDAAWHLEASRGGSSVQMWVRTRDGFPLRVVAPGGGGLDYTFTFDHFNTGATVPPATAIQLAPPARRLAGRVGDTLAVSTARVTVVSVDTDATADGAQPQPGNRFVVVEVAVVNTGGGPLSTYLDWRLQDAAGDTLLEAVPVREPAFLGGELAPGETAHGFLTYEVGDDATGLTLLVQLNADRATFTLG